MAQQLLRSGVTSVRVQLQDIKAAISFAAQSREDSSAVPRLIYGGPGLFAGQPDWYSGAHGAFVLYRGSLSAGPLNVERVRSVGMGGVLVVDNGQWLGSPGVT